MILEDNYVWFLIDYKKRCCIVIDPGEYDSILKFLESKKLILQAILLTHDHKDHTKGVFKLIQRFHSINVYGPYETVKCGTTKILKENDKFYICSRNFLVIEVPGHTLGHIAYYSPPYLFCGDTLFSGGCGNILENKFDLMYKSIQKLIMLPHNTLICSGHEYTLKNLEFAKFILPENKKIKKYKNKIKKLKYIFPNTFQIEFGINIFLFCNNKYLQKKLGVYDNNPLSTFKILRKMKNNF